MSGRSSTLVLAVLLCLGTAGCGGSHADKVGGSRGAKALVLTLASGNGSDGDVQQFARAVERLSNGALRIHVENAWRNGEPAYEMGLIRDVQAGKVDLGWAGTRVWDGVGVHSFDALHAPLLIDGYALERSVLDGPLPAAMLAGLRPLGLQGIGIVPGPMRRLAGAKPLRRPGDLAGLSVGIQDSRVADATLTALGARAVPIPANTHVRGLDAVEQQLGTIVSGRFDAEHPYVTANVALWPRPVVLFAGRRAVQRLSGVQLRLLRRAARAAIPAQLAQMRAGDQDAQRALCAGGVTFVDASRRDLVALRRAVAPVYAVLDRDASTAKALRAIEELKRRSGARATVVPACANRDAPAQGASMVDGLYTMTLTKAEMAQVVELESDQVAENWGNFRFALTHGDIAYTQENAEACTWFYGRYTVKGDKLDVEWVPLGGGIAPNGAIGMPHNVLFRWTRYHDLVKLSSDDPGGTEMLYANAWRRIGSDPTRADLSHRCPPPRKALPR